MPISSPLLVTFVALLTATACRATAAPTGTVLRIVPQADLTNLDPISTTNYVTRNHGYLVYDTLFGTDATGHIAPQMVESYTVTTDQKVWTFILREGLEFHDGTPVTSADVIASLQRWCERDTMGQRLRTFVARWDAVDSKTFRLTLKSRYGLVRESLGKPDSNVPFIMPRRIAQTPASSQITDATGSGPLIFKKDEWRPGEKAVYVRNPRYKPRQEPPSGTAGGKVARVDRIEWIVLKDPQTQVSALAAGDVDMIAYPIAEQYAALKRATGVQLFDAVPFLAQFDLIFNHQTPPFDNPRIRLAAMAALNQPAFLQTQVGNPDLYRVCLSVYSCDSPYVTSAGMDLLAHPNPAHARQMLKESGYRSEPIVLMAPTDLAVIAKLPGVAASLLREAGFVVDVQSMDWKLGAFTPDPSDRLEHASPGVERNVRDESGRLTAAERRRVSERLYRLADRCQARRAPQRIRRRTERSGAETHRSGGSDPGDGDRRLRAARRIQNGRGSAHECARPRAGVLPGAVEPGEALT
jgi:peptide/nickel transport system substrate-binding protein